MEAYELKTNFFSRILYKRNTRKAQKIINKRWFETDGVINYVGEWHTHPCMQVSPSDTDIHSLKEITAKVKDSLPGTLLIIVGKDEKINLIVQREDVIEMQLLSEEENGE